MLSRKDKPLKEKKIERLMIAVALGMATIFSFVSFGVLKGYEF